MKGKRVYAKNGGILNLSSGEYGWDPVTQSWKAKPFYFLAAADLKKHKVVEHEDGTITVSPSILITVPRIDKTYQWHGYLEKGVWREV